MFTEIKKNIAKILALMLVITSFSARSYAVTDIIDISGKDRYETSLKASSYVDSDILVIASGRNYADSLSAFNLASRFNARLILVSEKTDPGEYLKGYKPKKIYIVGGKKAINGEMLSNLKAKTENVVRISGKDRYETNEKTLAVACFDKVAVVSGRNYADALSASGLLKNRGLGLKMVNGSKPYKSRRKVVYTIGEKNSVVQDGGKRLGGNDRYATNDRINREMGKADVIAMTDGRNYPDALSAVNIINSSKGPAAVMLIGNSVNPERINYINSTKAKYLIGGSINRSATEKIYGKNSYVAENNTVKKATRVNEKSSIDISSAGNVLKKPDAENPVVSFERNPGIKKGNKHIYYSFYVLDEEKPDKFRQIHAANAGDFNSIKRNVPRGYRMASDDGYLKRLKVSRPSGNIYINGVFISKNSTLFLPTQSDYDNYIYNGLKNGFNEGKILVGKNVVPNKGLEILADGMGFELHQTMGNIVVEGSSLKLKVANLKLDMRQAYYTKEVYDKNVYTAHMNRIRSMIRASGADRMKSKRDKAYIFGKYLLANYVYNSEFQETQHECLKSISPYSITDYHTAICEGYVYTFNQAMLLMGIESYQVGDDEHMVARTRMESGWRYLNVTGFEHKKYNSALKVPDSAIDSSYAMSSPVDNVTLNDAAMNSVSYLYR